MYKVCALNTPNVSNAIQVDHLQYKLTLFMLLMKTIIATSIPAVFAAAGIYHLRNIYNATHCVPVDKISFSSEINKSFQTSASVKITNPRSHVPLRDSRSLTIAVPKTLSDEEVLTRFVKGFFGGHVFGLERGILRAARHELTHFKGEYQ